MNQEREALYEDVLRQKLTANAYRDENIRLRTRLQALEEDLLRRERLVDELVAKPEGNSKGKKIESHLTLNLKRRVKEMQAVVAAKAEELELLKRNMKTTKSAELEAEVRAYTEECQRLRGQLEEVIKSKDTFADPDEIRLIEDRFQAQEQVIANLR